MPRLLVAFLITAFYADLRPRRAVFRLIRVSLTSQNRQSLFVGCSGFICSEPYRRRRLSGLFQLERYALSGPETPTLPNRTVRYTSKPTSVSIGGRGFRGPSQHPGPCESRRWFELWKESFAHSFRRRLERPGVSPCQHSSCGLAKRTSLLSALNRYRQAGG